jgi:hypothetical protein
VPLKVHVVNESKCLPFQQTFLCLLHSLMWSFTYHLSNHWVVVSRNSPPKGYIILRCIKFSERKNLVSNNGGQQCVSPVSNTLSPRISFIHKSLYLSSYKDLPLLFSNQIVNPPTSSPADDVHHDVIPPKLLLTNRVYFQQTSGIHTPVGKRKGCSLSGRSPAPIADSFHVATISRKHSVMNLRDIDRNNTHTALAYGLTYYR